MRAVGAVRRIAHERVTSHRCVDFTHPTSDVPDNQPGGVRAVPRAARHPTAGDELVAIAARNTHIVVPHTRCTWPPHRAATAPHGSRQRPAVPEKPALESGNCAPLD